jgi:DNA polymerase-3 subunit delta
MSRPSIIVLFGAEEYPKALALQRALDGLLPPEVDRQLALTTYDGGQPADQGGPEFAPIRDDLATLPFLADRRVVVVRAADRFVSANRENLEAYAVRPSPTATLILECRSFPKTTRLYKAVVAGGGVVQEFARLKGRAVIDCVLDEARRQGKTIAPGAAARLAGLVGADQGALAAEVEKLTLYVGDRRAITDEDITALVGQSREETIFAAVDAAAAGDARAALQLWNQVLATERAAVFMAIGGIAYRTRNWLAAARMQQEGVPVDAIAPRVHMYGRARELESLLQRMPPQRMRRALAGLAEADAAAKSGLRSLENAVEAWLLAAASR